MNKKLIAGFFLLLSVSLYSYDYSSDLHQGGAIIIPIYSSSGQLVSVKGTMLMNVPYDYVWEAITDIANYKEFYPRMSKSEIQSVEENGNIIVADFIILVPIFPNSVYTNKYVINQKNGTVDIYQHSGHLKGSYFHWRVSKKEDNQTWVSYNGISKNYSPIIENIEDKDQAIALTMNLSVVYNTLRQIHDRGRTLWKRKITAGR